MFKTPFPHIVIDNFLNEELAIELSNEFPDYKDEKWYYYDNPLENKKANNNWGMFPPSTYNFFHYLNSDVFIVNSEKAYFYSEPNLSLKRKGYLVKGESGKSLTKHNEFVYVVFTNLNGITSEGWLYSKDLELIPKLNENNVIPNDSFPNDPNKVRN
jgi:glucan-binding YG repeat protein